MLRVPKVAKLTEAAILFYSSRVKGMTDLCEFVQSPAML